MQAMASEREDTGRAETFKERLAGARARAMKLAATRAAIFREELSEKGAHAARAVAGIAVALFFLGLALLVATALVVALFSSLFGSLVLGTAATLVLYVAIAAVGGLVGVRAFQKVEPTHFPATAGGIRDDLSALSFAAAPPPSPSPRPEERGADDLESRYRAGSE
jgi:uncharacterized membrane protein YqjE